MCFNVLPGTTETGRCGGRISNCTLHEDAEKATGSMFGKLQGSLYSRSLGLLNFKKITRDFTLDTLVSSLAHGPFLSDFSPTY